MINGNCYSRFNYGVVHHLRGKENKVKMYEKCIWISVVAQYFERTLSPLDLCFLKLQIYLSTVSINHGHVTAISPKRSL